MEKHRFASLLIPSIIAFLGLMAFGLCVAAEFKRSKKKDVKLNGKLCYLAESGAFQLGVAALICLFIAHILGNMVICRRICSGEKSSSGKAKTPWITSTLLVVSWWATRMVFGGETNRQTAGDASNFLINLL
ncbi:protein MODIFYING WALL LIGNIN-1 isoform X2 [Vitis vinifera]|uniref:protein MODIFYING WALL LIGNIN-1 isoform X2 n=1 Tax=Vitis vinifera TaxID=29760 RepID=UPI00053FD4AC|nr:protein MODIFYING WALL LIGNIN-1 isoform X2 [Vitis vinifera]|eukprot:XP_010644493.1 PREDICTED: uncharacterized protein LOC100266552 isoform X2 [Vitis vinifera]